MTNKLMIIDGSNLAYRANYTFKNIKTSEGFYAGVIYGFLKILRSYIIKFQPTDLVICFDTPKSKKSNFRIGILPEYKMSRVKRRIDFDITNFNKQISILIRIFRYMGIKVIADKEGLGKESDDYIAKLALENPYHTIIISADKDFVQLINEYITLYHPGKETLITHKNCQRVMEFNPSQYLDYLILDGDQSDNIPGYKGMGIVKIKKFLEQYESIVKALKDPGFKNHEVMTKEGLEFLYKRNRSLIDLKYILKNYPIYKIPYIPTKGYNRDKLLTILDKYGMANFISPSFIDAFKPLINK